MKYLFLYRSIATPSLIITTIVCVQLVIYHGPQILMLLIWEKLIALGAIILHLYYFKSGYFIFFNNLGIPRRSFLWFAVAIDLILFGFAVGVVLLAIQ